jgi:hypothetical protein
MKNFEPWYTEIALSAKGQMLSCREESQDRSTRPLDSSSLSQRLPIGWELKRFWLPLAFAFWYMLGIEGFGCFWSPFSKRDRSLYMGWVATGVRLSLATAGN